MLLNNFWFEVKQTMWVSRRMVSQRASNFLCMLPGNHLLQEKRTANLSHFPPLPKKLCLQRRWGRKVGSQILPEKYPDKGYTQTKDSNVNKWQQQQSNSIAQTWSQSFVAQDHLLVNFSWYSLSNSAFLCLYLIWALGLRCFSIYSQRRFLHCV